MERVLMKHGYMAHVLDEDVQEEDIKESDLHIQTELSLEQTSDFQELKVNTTRAYRNCKKRPAIHGKVPSRNYCKDETHHRGGEGEDDIMAPHTVKAKIAAGHICAEHKAPTWRGRRPFHETCYVGLLPLKV